MKNVLGSPFTKLSEVPFEQHSREGLVRRVNSRWAHMQVISTAIVGAATIGGVARAISTYNNAQQHTEKENNEEENAAAQEQEQENIVQE